LLVESPARRGHEVVIVAVLEKADRATFGTGFLFWTASADIIQLRLRRSALCACIVSVGMLGKFVVDLAVCESMQSYASLLPVTRVPSFFARVVLLR